MKKSNSAALLSFGLVAITATNASADEQDLAKQLSNPIASLISVPLQWNYDQNIGPDRDGERFTLNVQPVIPFSISDDWNVISRTIVPIVSQDDIFPGAGDQFGLGDTLQNFFSRRRLWGKVGSSGEPGRSFSFRRARMNC